MHVTDRLPLVGSVAGQMVGAIHELPVRRMDHGYMDSGRGNS